MLGRLVASSDKNQPEKIGKYEIQGILGRGAMGVVYKGFDPKIERLVAIKTVRADLLVGADGEDWLARFSREARAAGRCLHPNIVALFDYDQHEGMPFIAMEYVEGRELADLFKGGKKFDQVEALDVIRQVLSALDYAHASGIVHRDIKPANIILVEDGTVKVTDFGIARLDTVNLTQHGSMIGTPSYMSPEQFTGKTVDHRSDLFSCGVLLFELLTGEKPFPGTTMTEIMYKVLHEHPRELTDVNHFVPTLLNDVVRKALAKDPDERFLHAADFYNALENGLDELVPAGLGTPVEDPDVGATVVVSQRGPVVEPGAEPGVLALAALDAAVLKKVEEDLAVYMGPIAKILVKKAAKKSETTDDLGRRLAGSIPDQRQSEEFLKRVMRTLGRPALTARLADDLKASGTTAPGLDDSLSDGSLPGTSVFSKELLKTVELGLAQFLGPIARVLVKKAVKKSGSLNELYDHLAAHLNSEHERAVFFAGKPDP